MQYFSKKFSAESIPDLTGKVIIVIGGATGIGKQTVIQLLRRNAEVYIASRSESKFQQLSDHLKSADVHMATNVKFLKLDLSDIRSCISAAEHFTQLEERLDVLIASAALSVVPHTLSKDGIEIQFAASTSHYLGHFVFTYYLQDLIRHTSEVFGEARIVIVASHTHSMYRPISSNKIDFEGHKAEGSKAIENLAEVQASLQSLVQLSLLSLAVFTRIFRRQGTQTFLSIHLTQASSTVGTAPGTDSAALPPMIGFISSSIVRWTSIPPEDGSLTTLLLATDPEIK
ncbi:putative carbonyl reductase [Ilyonectria destructans]|nr:putative carbonyl reductase [Ilyonectria destructans]